MKSMGFEMDFSQLIEAAKKDLIKQVVQSPEAVAVAKEAAQEQASMTIGESIIKYWPVAVGVIGLSVYGIVSSLRKR